MIRLAWLTVRTRRGGFAAAFLAVLCGAAVLTACGILLESSVRPAVPPERYRAADLVIGAPQSMDLADDVDPRFPERATVPASLIGDIAGLPGVRAAIGDVSVPMTVLRSGEAATGHGWQSTALGGYRLVSGRAPATADEVVLDAALAARSGVDGAASAPAGAGGESAARSGTGTVIRLVTRSDVAEYRVTGIVGGPVTRQPALFLTDERARELTGRPDRVDTIGVLAGSAAQVSGAGEAEAAAGARVSGPAGLSAEIAAVTPGLVVYSGDGRSDAEFLDVGTARAFLGELALAFGGSMILVIVIVVASTVTLTVRQRLAEFTLLRAVGATPGQVLRMILAETTVVGVLGAVCGVLPGIGLSMLLRQGFVWSGALPEGFGLTVSPAPVPVALGSCLVSALLGGWVAARGAVRGRALEAPRRPGRIRLLAGLSLIPAGLATAFAGSEESAAFSAFLFLFAAGLLGPWLVNGLVTALTPRRPAVTPPAARLRAVDPPAAWLNVVAPLAAWLRPGRAVGGFLAVANARAESRRIAAAAIPMIMGVILATGQLAGGATAAAAARQQAGEGLLAGVVVTSASAGLSPEVAGLVRAVPGTGAVTAVVRSRVTAVFRDGDSPQIRSYEARGLTGDRLPETLDLGVADGDVTALRTGTVILSRTAADTLGLGLGDHAGLRLGDGTPITPEVVAIHTRSLGFGDVILPHDLVLDHTTDRADHAVLISTVQDAGLLRAALADLPTIRIDDRRSPPATDADAAAVIAGAGDEGGGGDFGAGLLLTMVLLGYLAIAVVNTLVTATVARAREFTLLRLIGASRHQILAMMRGETRIVVGAAVVIGAVAVTPALIGTSLALTGSPLPVVPPLLCLGIVLTAALLGRAAVMIPARILTARGGAAQARFNVV
ncbi:MAG TPA: ABC transporter permease [Actinoplanes sp.]|nr:ABC transporter permease [Actinoplanes sp.]